ncbi:MAG: hypothetical protein J7K85_03480 [Anaerolineaceae bacterium]|nr:hypothetical protein [Anaerolineaceae bacterium]
MNYETLFTEKEITLIAFAPAIAANGIAMVDGTISEEETLAISAHLLDATERYRHNKLIMLAIQSFSRLMRKGEIPGDMRYIRSPEEYLRTFRKVGKLIDKKVKNQEGTEYKHYLVDLMKSVASASGPKRRSFFGRGNVSDQEQQFLDHIADILKIS